MEIGRYNLEVVCIRETHKTQSRQKIMNLEEKLLYSSHEETASYTQKVALILSKEAQRALIG